jgi:hypothetical protein
MASIKYLQNIDLHGSQLQNAVVQPVGSSPTVYGNGQIYYDTGVHKLFLRANGAWVAIQSGTEANTTYDLSGVGSSNGSAGIRLAGSDGTNDDVLIVGAGTVGVTRSGNTLTVTGTDSAAGTVTSVSGGTGITISGSATVTPTVNIDYAGTDNAILSATAATPVGADTLWFSDAGDNTIKKSLLSNFPGFGADGTVLSVATGAGLTGGTITTSGTLAVDYAGSDNVVLAASDGTSITLADADDFLFSDATDTNAKYANLSQLKTYINAAAGSVTSVGVSGGSTGMSFSNSPITSNGTMTMSGTLDVDNGGTGLSSYTTGDILYASGASTLAKLGIGSAGQVLKVSSGGIVEWAADTNTGLTSVGITETGSALTITNSPLTSNGNINIAGAGSASQVILGNLTLATLPVDGVTSIGITPGTGLDVSNSPITSSGNIGITLDLSELTTVTTIDPAADFLVGVDGTANEKILYQNVHLNQWGAAEADVAFGSNKLTGVANGTASSDGVNLGQVQSLVAGVGVFQGGYNASTNSPAIAGASNTALTTGDFFVVTTDGTIAFNGSSVAVEVGDMIYANSNISASSNPAATAYSIVIQDQNIAGTGATDGATEKGVAGFSSASFSATANGFVTIKSGGISNAMLANTPNYIIGTDSDINTSGVIVIDQLNMTDGVIQSHSTRTLPDSTTGARGVTEIATQAEVDAGTDSFRYVTPATLKSHVDAQSYAVDWPSSDSASQAITHSLGTLDVVVQVYEKSSGNTVFCGVERNSTTQVTITTSGTTTANTLRVLVQKIR